MSKHRARRGVTQQRNRRHSFRGRPRNRRRRRGWLTPAGRAVVLGGLASVFLVVLLVPQIGESLSRRGQRSAIGGDVVALEPIDGRPVASPGEPSGSLSLTSPRMLAALDERPWRTSRSTLEGGSPRGGSGSSASGAPPPVSAPPREELAIARTFDPPLSRARFEAARHPEGMVDPTRPPRLAEWREPDEADLSVALPGLVRVEYTMDESLTERVFEILRRGRVARGVAIVLDPRTGRLLAYASMDEDALPAGRAYPAASIVKILTASAVLERRGARSTTTCVYRGNKYRLNRRRLKPPKTGREASLESALASSNNQCFARWALNLVGAEGLRETFERFGWLSAPAPGHDAGWLEDLDSDLDLGRLGSGLDGIHVTPLHVAQMASILTHGEWIEPWWIDRVVDAFGRPLQLPARRPNRPVIDRGIADRLRSMMVATTKRGTAKSAFRDRRGRPRVGGIDVAGKTGNLTGWDPYGRYEWFLGLAPADEPAIAVVVLQLQGHMWWRRSTELASDVLRAVFCDKSGCRHELAARWTGDGASGHRPTLVSETHRPRVVADSK